MKPPETVTTFMEDGCVSVTVGNLTGVVSSAHLVEPRKISSVNGGWKKTPSMTTEADPQNILACCATGS